MAELRVCFFGDSFVNGTGDPEGLGWAGRVCRAARRRGHEVTCYNLGIRRETSTELRARWRQEAERRLTAASDGRIVFSFGVNDTARAARSQRVLPSDSLDNFVAMLTEARERYPVLVVGPPPVANAAHTARTAELSANQSQIAFQMGVPALNLCSHLHTSTRWPRELEAGDGAHPGAKGYAILARIIDHWWGWRAWLP
jgi:lysophospholipase L1-like esterase